MGRKGFRALQIRQDALAASWVAGLDQRTKQGRMLRKGYDTATSRLKDDFLFGEVVPVPLDPRFRGATNLRCVDLPAFHRLLYTNVRVAEGTIVFIIDVVDHGTYDRLFGVRKR